MSKNMYNFAPNYDNIATGTPATAAATPDGV